jgi:hypothetical protein
VSELESALEPEPEQEIEQETELEPEPASEPEPEPEVKSEPAQALEPEPPATTDKPTDTPTNAPTNEEPAVFEAGDTSVEAVLASLTLGVWVDLLSQGSRLRALLVWSIPTLTLFMFSSVGGRTHSMSRRSCIKLIQEGRLSLASAAPDVQLAIRSFTNT